MLILTRRAGERICIGDNIIIEVMETRNCQAKIGIDAPREIEVHREEIYDLIESQDNKGDREDILDNRGNLK